MSKRSAVRTLWWTTFILFALGTGALGGLVGAYVRDLPPLDPLEEYRPSLVTTLYADTGEPFASFYEQKRILVPLSRIPRFLIDAVIATEDSRFYQHGGLDPVGISRAFWVNLKCLCLAEGGSTITQQLAKVLFLTPEKSLIRKLKEALLALKIEGRYPKEKILEFYFNQIYFGQGAYGIEAASQTYFQKPVDQLNLADAALLAGLPRAPNYYSPFNDPERARRRRSVVLRRMREEGFITQEQATAASRVPISHEGLVRTRELAPHFVEYIRQALEDKYGTWMLYHGGLKVYTTLNLRMQQAAEQALKEGIRQIDKQQGFRLNDTLNGTATPTQTRQRPPEVGEVVQAVITRVTPEQIQVQIGEYRGTMSIESLRWTGLTDLTEAFPPDMVVKVKVQSIGPDNRIVVSLEQEPKVEGAFVAIDPRQGEVKALVGGYDFRRSKFNRAIQAKRQPGSAFKPFVYVTALDQGFTPATIFDDSPISFSVTVDGQVTEWSPENYGKTFRGPVTLRQALEKSINVVAVKLIERVGVEPVIRMARRLGIRSNLRPEYGLSLGASEVSLLELVSAYGVFANAGTRVEPFFIRKVMDHEGRALEVHFPDPQQVLKPSTAFVLTHILKGVVERGTGKRARVLERPLAAKTGTSQDASDVWFLGYTPSLVAGVWIGYDQVQSLGPYATSGYLAVPIWIDFAREVFKGTPAEDFPVPEGVVAMTVDHATGEPSPPSNPQAITEYFLMGTEPYPLAARSGPTTSTATDPSTSAIPLDNEPGLQE